VVDSRNYRVVCIGAVRSAREYNIAKNNNSPVDIIGSIAVNEEMRGTADRNIAKKD